MGHTVGVDLGGHFIKVGLVDEDGNVMLRTEAPTMADRGREASLRQLVGTVRDFLSRCREYGTPEGIGVGSPGLVDVEAGIVRFSPNFPGWLEVPLRQTLQEATGLPVALGNDANIAALAENTFGAGKDLKTFVFATLGTGVGGALILDGRLFTGPLGAAGEVGHITVDPNGPRCNCGNYGCLERFVGIDYIVERAREKLRTWEGETLIPNMVEGDMDKLTPKHLSDAAELGDRLALKVWEEIGTYLGLNPEAFVLGGGVSNAGEVLLRPIRETIRKRAMQIPAGLVRVLRAQVGPDAGVIGASLSPLSTSLSLHAPHP
ncbi:MAG TPA: ROK family protein [Candidatus Latescibacteria bacterium]|nr:ROK family protein [Candidatus Latescibacterota bacterium]